MWAKLDVGTLGLQEGDLVMDTSLTIAEIRRWADTQVWMTEVTWETGMTTSYDNSDFEKFTVLRKS